MGIVYGSLAFFIIFTLCGVASFFIIREDLPPFIRKIASYPWLFKTFLSENVIRVKIVLIYGVFICFTVLVGFLISLWFLRLYSQSNLRGEASPYDSIWSDIYGKKAPYQKKLENQVVEGEYSFLIVTPSKDDIHVVEAVFYNVYYWLLLGAGCTFFLLYLIAWVCVLIIRQPEE